MNGASLFVAALLSVGLLTTPVSAREISDLNNIQRETRIVSDVIRAALRDQLRRDVRVTSLSAEYLARQGVLVSITLNTPWIKIGEEGEPSFDFHGNVTMVEIPEMVTNILQDLQIHIPPFEPESIEDLKALREEQRELRRDARELRSDLREKRRELVRRDDDDDELNERVAILEAELATVESQFNELSAEIDATYQELKAPTTPSISTTQAVNNKREPIDLAMIVAQTACDYGDTLKSLNSDEYLTFSLRRGKTTEYFAFEMNHVRQCSGDERRVERLLDLAYRYEG
ncbi:MAG: hypothetical protein GKR90_22945 [Pseudomonadales bacterium]|nr:hypothetical protein [Pseudomonadales bacterium]